MNDRNPKRNGRRVVLLLLSPPLGLALAVSGCLLISGGGDGLCGDEVVDRQISPDGSLAAVTFERNCGITTSTVTHVAITGSGEREVDSSDIVATIAGYGSAVTVIWKSATDLVLEVRADIEVKRRKPECHGINVVVQRKKRK